MNQLCPGASCRPYVVGFYCYFYHSIGITAQCDGIIPKGWESITGKSHQYGCRCAIIALPCIHNRCDRIHNAVVTTTTAISDEIVNSLAASVRSPYPHKLRSTVVLP